MLRIPAVVAVVAVMLCAAAWSWASPGPGFDPARAEAARGAPSLAGHLHYIGRDTATGMPVPVNDRFIFESARAIERYGMDAREPVPPPPVVGVDIASVVIPGLNVSARVRPFGLDRFGRLDVPSDGVSAGWYPAYSDVPGAGGATFIAAHYEYGGVPGIFFRLSTLRPGNEVQVVAADGMVHRYRVTSTVDYELATVDMGAILHGREGAESLTLMTCSGPVISGEYALRTVVLAERVEG